MTRATLEGDETKDTRTAAHIEDTLSRDVVREDQWSLNLLITKASLHLMPVIGQSVAQSHAVWKPEWRTWAKVRHHKGVSENHSV